MTPDDIQKLLDDFSKFDIITTSGHRYKVDHVENIRMTNRLVFIFTGRGPTFEDYATVPFDQISAIEGPNAAVAD